MSKTCGECTYLNISPGKGDLYGKFPCEKKYEWHLATDQECDRFCTAYDRDYYTIQNAHRYSQEHSSSGGCYLTTMLCNILKMPDNNIYLETMRDFRNNVLQKDEKYKSILVEYDIIGPKIAQFLKSDPLKENIAKKYLNTYISPITNLINDQKFEMAISLYMSMTNSLSLLYNLNCMSISTLDIDNADIENSGHGIYKTKKITQNI